VILGLEISREFASAVLCDPEGAAQYALRRDWPAHAPPRAQWMSAMEMCRDLLQRGALESAQIERAGVAFDGLVTAGIAQNDPTRPGWAGYDLSRALHEHLGISNVAAASRVTCEGLGEARFGALRGQNSWIFVHLGRELQSAACWQGQIVGGDIGGLTIERDGTIDAFGKRGTLRAYCSGAALESRARSFGMTAQSASEIWELAPSNFAAKSLCDDFVSRLAQGLAGAASLLADVPIGIGGAFGRAIWPQIAAPLASKLREMAPKSPQITVGALGEDAATLGAVALALI